MPSVDSETASIAPRAVWYYQELINFLQHGDILEKLYLHWSSSIKNGQKNFGDWLSPVLCHHLSGKEIVHAKANQADLVAIGSILQRVKNRFWNRKTNIWGSGFIKEQAPITAKHTFHAVRGKKTAFLIKGAEIKTLGDPGLLVNMLFPEHNKTEKKHKVGLVAHYKDQNSSLIKELQSTLDDEVLVIDIFSETYDFMKKVASCECILSSSLHGLVTADAFGIPNSWLKLSDQLRGGYFKFQDYYSVFDIEATPLFPEMISSELIEKIKDNYYRRNLDQIRHELLQSFPFSIST